MFADLIKDIKSKKLKNLDDKLIEKEIKEYIKKNGEIKIKSKRSEKYRKIVKEIRSELNRVYGQFWWQKTSFKQRNFSKELYKKIFKITKKPKVLLDIACGLNPWTYEDKSIKYIVTELTKIDCALLKDYLKNNNFKFKVLQVDLRENKKLPKADVAFLFRILDVLKDKKLAEKIIKNLEVNFIVVSFSLITIKNKKMNFPYFPWFERLLGRLKLDYEKLLYPSEIFYVIKK